MRFLGHNYSSISQNDLYDFIFNDWLKPSENDMRDLFKQTLMLNHCKKNGLEWSPGRLEGNLEIIYILYITDIVKDISAIKEMAQDYPHLQFLLYPESFDYKQVDFANYMWANFSHSKKTMHYFVEHKDDIMPRIVERLKMNKATENEKKVLYGFFLDEKEIWNIG